MRTGEAIQPPPRARLGERLARASVHGARALAHTLSGSTTARATVILAVFVAASLLTRLPFLRADFVNVDEAAHLVGSWELLRGGHLYLDFADNKPPLIYAFYAVAQLFFGKGLFAVRLFATLALLPLTALAAAAFFDYGRAGLAAGLAFLLASATLLASDAHAVHCEHVMLLPLAWSLVVVRSRRALSRGDHLFAAGLLLGIATLGKQPAAACLLAPAGAALHGQWRAFRQGCVEHPADGMVLSPAGARALRRWAALRVLGRGAALVISLLAGFWLPLALTLGWFGLRGSLEQALFWIVTVNLAHIDNPMPFADRALRVVSMGALVLPAALPLVAGAWLGRAEPARLRRPPLPALLALATFLPVGLGLRLFGHYFIPFLFALSLFAAPALGGGARCAPVATARARLRVIAAALAAFGAMTGVSLVVHAPGRGLADITRPEYEHIGKALRNDTCSRDGSLFVWGYAPTIYAYSGEPPASRFVLPIDGLTGYLTGNTAAAEGRLDTHDRLRPAQWNLLMADLENHKPAHIVDTAPADLNHWGAFGLDQFPRLLQFLRRDYQAYAVIDGAVIYRRNTCSAAFVEARR